MIYDWYSNQTVKVRWAGAISEAFGVSNGVRQGGVLSPIFFNIIIDELLNKVERTGYGARVAGASVGCIAYADDITLISPTVSGIQAMLDVCESFVQDNLLKFNVNKSVVTVFRRRRLADPGNPRFVIDSGVLPVKELPVRPNGATTLQYCDRLLPPVIGQYMDFSDCTNRDTNRMPEHGGASHRLRL